MRIKFGWNVHNMKENLYKLLIWISMRLSILLCLYIILCDLGVEFRKIKNHFNRNSVKFNSLSKLYVKLKVLGKLGFRKQFLLRFLPRACKKDRHPLAG